MRRYSTEEGYDIFPDVLPFFQTLKGKSSSGDTNAWPWERTVVGIITNSDDRVPGILESFGLKIGPTRVGTSDHRSIDAAMEEDISFVVMSYDVGVEKPDRRIFDAAVSSFNKALKAEDNELQAKDFEKLYVGDSQVHDFFGAKGAGWDALLLDRDGTFKQAFAKEGKDLVTVTVNEEEGDNVTSLHVIKTLKALSDWSPSNLTR